MVRYVPDPVLDAWPSHELAYVVGLIASDGNLQRRNHCVILVSTDEQIIDWGTRLLHLPSPQIIVNKQSATRKTSFMLQVCDHRFRGFLEALGLTPAKTLTLGPLIIPDEVFCDFVRGELDGDGSWYIAKGWRESKYLVAKLTSRSQKYIEWLKRIY